MEELEPSPTGSSMRRGITAEQISRAVEVCPQQPTPVMNSFYRLELVRVDVSMHSDATK
jgi:hypothetical protein